MLETIKDIRKKAKKHRELLENNETVTRYALVDPLLIALDWDVADPSVVVAEHCLQVRAEKGGAGSSSPF